MPPSFSRGTSPRPFPRTTLNFPCHPRVPRDIHYSGSLCDAVADFNLIYISVTHTHPHSSAALFREPPINLHQLRKQCSSSHLEWVSSLLCMCPLSPDSTMCHVSRFIYQYMTGPVLQQSALVQGVVGCGVWRCRVCYPGYAVPLIGVQHGADPRSSQQMGETR
ncbi:hypothetical protein BC834DRAFT_296166 [Gloeopeniophorella convolvens]|nr:hypothetical protein BC834DRAFT_296166 [Gloeopeniophorella convolvens]